MMFPFLNAGVAGGMDPLCIYPYKGDACVQVSFY